MIEQCFSYNTDNLSYQEVETKGEKEYYIEGYVATDDPDLVNDIMTKSCLEDMDNQMDNVSIKFDIEHETVADGKISENMNINPVARVVDHRVDNNGLWVKAMVNSYHEKFTELWGSVKSGMIDAFSVAFLPVQKAMKYVKGKSMRLLEKVKLINIAFTGNPVNPEAKMCKIIGKSLDFLEKQEENIFNKEAEVKALCTSSGNMPESQSTPNGDDNKTMVEEDKPILPEEQPIEEVKEEVKEEVVETEEEKSEPVEATESAEEVDVKSIKAELVSLKSDIVSLKEENAKLRNDLTKPEFKGTVESQPEVTKLKPQKSVLGLI